MTMAEWYPLMVFRPNSIVMNRSETVVPSQSHSTQWINNNTHIKKLFYVFIFSVNIIFVVHNVNLKCTWWFKWTSSFYSVNKNYFSAKICLTCSPISSWFLFVLIFIFVIVFGHTVHFGWLVTHCNGLKMKLEL